MDGVRFGGRHLAYHNGGMLGSWRLRPNEREVYLHSTVRRQRVRTSSVPTHRQEFVQRQWEMHGSPNDGNLQR